MNCTSYAIQVQIFPKCDGFFDLTSEILLESIRGDKSYKVFDSNPHADAWFASRSV